MVKRWSSSDNVPPYNGAADSLHTLGLKWGQPSQQTCSSTATLGHLLRRYDNVLFDTANPKPSLKAMHLLERLC